ncbi:MAG: hypothetical protein ACRDHO_13950 [Actinomycetota bacterium]
MSEQARLEYMEPLGLDVGYAALKSDDLPGLRMSQSHGVQTFPHTLMLAGRDDEVFARTDLGGHEKGRLGFTVALDMRLNRFMAVWALERTLLGYEMAFGRLRDSLAEALPSSVRRSLSSLEVAIANVATLGGDARAVAEDARRFAAEPEEFRRDMPSFTPVDPRAWRSEGAWNEMFREGIAASAERVRQSESVARDLEMTRASIMSSRANLTLQAWLRRLTAFLVVLTIVLVIVAVATLQAMD